MNAWLAKAIGVMMKLDFERAVLNRIPQIEADKERHFHEVLFLCDEYQHFATVGESDPTRKTTLLNGLGNFIPPDERILLIEDTTEIQLAQSNLVRFEPGENRTAYLLSPFVTFSKPRCGIGPIVFCWGKFEGAKRSIFCSSSTPATRVLCPRFMQAQQDRD